jgi:thioredoxin reductase (NADPH)
VNAASEGISTVVLDRIGPGGQVAGSSRIENFIGFPAGLSGTELATRGVLQMLKFGARMIAPVSVDRLETASATSGLHSLHLDCGTTVRSPIILLAPGVVWRKLEAENVGRFDEAGVHYVCTSAEADLYRDSDVGVVGSGNSAGQAAVYLAGCCPKRQVHMFIRRELGPGMSKYLVDRILAASTVRLTIRRYRENI